MTYPASPTPGCHGPNAHMTIGEMSRLKGRFNNLPFYFKILSYNFETVSRSVRPCPSPYSHSSREQSCDWLRAVCWPVPNVHTFQMRIWCKGVDNASVSMAPCLHFLPWLAPPHLTHVKKVGGGSIKDGHLQGLRAPSCWRGCTMRDMMVVGVLENGGKWPAT